MGGVGGPAREEGVAGWGQGLSDKVIIVNVFIILLEQQWLS